jgi:hypothetical protein
MKVRLKLRSRRVGNVECPLPVVRLQVRDRHGTLARLYFRLDTQADFTTIPIAKAETEGIPFSRARESTGFGLVGETTMYRDRVRVIIAGREHDWPCHFIQVSAARQPSTREELLPVLGRAGFLDEYAVAVDSGYLIITRLGPVRRLLRRGLHRLWKAFGMVHPPDRPL